MEQPKTNEPTIDAIMQVGLGFWASKTLLSAIEMEVFTELAGHAEDLNTLQGRLGLHPRSARDFLDALVALGFLQRVNGKYSNTPSTDKFLDRRKPSYVGGILEMANRRLYPFWGNLTEALRTGEPQNEAESRRAQFFCGALCRSGTPQGIPGGDDRHQHGANRRSPASFPGRTTRRSWTSAPRRAIWSCRLRWPTRISRASASICRKSAPIFEEYVAANGLKSRVTFHAGSFFEDDLPKADVVMMGHILHDWNLRKRKSSSARLRSHSPGRRADRL